MLFRMANCTLLQPSPLELYHAQNAQTTPGGGKLLFLVQVDIAHLVKHFTTSDTPKDMGALLL